MEQVIHFETTVERGIIRIPEQFIRIVPAVVSVTLAPIKKSRIVEGSSAEAGILSIDNFKALRIDTQNWKFNREEANERR